MTRRGNGFGSLINKGEGRPWLARWVYKGHVYYKSTGEVDKKKALKKLEYITRPYREQREIDVQRNLLNRIQSLQECMSKNALPIESIWDEFAKKLKHEDVESGTTRNYESAVNMMVKWMNGKVKFAKDITKQLAEEYLAELASSVGANTYNIRLVLFKRIWKSLKDEFNLNENTWEEFKKRKATKSSRKTLSNKELASVIAKADSFDMKLLLSIGIYTGLRISDCSLLKWEDVDLERKIIKTIPIKTRKHTPVPIEIPIHPALMKMFEEAPHEGKYVSETNASEYVNGHINGKVVKLFQSCGMVTSMKDENGKLKLLRGFHSLRHTFVSNAIDCGMSPLLVQKIVGHSAVDMTSSYYHDNEEKMREGIDALCDVAQMVA